MIYILLFLFLGLGLGACLHLNRTDKNRHTRKDRHYE